ncbi:MAG: Stk1 family PASTA domain-containing Ser/Thr kinase [Solirubrobacteraceae bacterium]
MPEPQEGSVVDGRYRIVSRLGAGGMADVYLAEDQQLQRKVALKLLYRRFAEDPDFVERFRREAQAAAGLAHPNVVSVYDRGSFEGTYYIAMEYLPGRSLKDLIRQEAPLAPVRAIDIAIQVLKAARFAHRRGVIHRDLKPHNVLVDEADHAKVTDFGIARAGASDMTETGSIMGTAQYLSPEQAQGHAVTETSDLYSIGIVLYEMLTGRLPFDGEAAVTIALKHVSEAPTRPSSLNPALSPELEQVVLWSLNKNPADRPADADQFITALEQVREMILAGGRGQQTASMPALGALAAGGLGAVAGGLLGAGGAAAAAGAAPVPPGPAAASGLSGSGAGAGERAAGAPPVGGTPAYGPNLRRPEGNGAHPGDPDRGEPGRRRPAWPWLLLVLVVLGGGVAAYVLSRPSKHLVPTVVGESVSVAQTQVQNAGFTPNLVYRSDAHPQGTVIGQSPLGGTKAATGSTVTLTVSQGPGSVPVPSVDGLTLAQARRQLRNVGLKVAREPSESSMTVPAGRATRTDPASGTSLPVGSGVTLFVSSGPAKVAVPDVRGKSEADARTVLVAAGFTNITTSSQVTAGAPPGTVVDQTPAGGSQAAMSAQVALVLAKAPTATTLPGVVGDTAAAASGALTAAGFKVRQQTQTVTKQNQDGIVISQSPPANGTAANGATVTIVVGKYQAPKPGTKTTPTTPTSPTTTPGTSTTG